MTESICQTIGELETVVSVGIAALARSVDPEKLQIGLDYVSSILSNENAKLTEGERRGLEFLSGIIELRTVPILVNAPKSKPSHLQVVK